MNDHVAVLRVLRDFYSGSVLSHPEKAAALDHAIAAVAERDALVARLGELEKAWRAFADELDQYPPTPATMAFVAQQVNTCADALARVVAGNGGGD